MHISGPAVHLLIPGATSEIPVTGEVAFVVTPEAALRDGKEAGAGVRFTALDPLAAEVLEHFVESIRAHSRGRILLVDDEPDVLDLLAVLLSGQGFSAVTVSSAERALEILTFGGFDLVISDLYMPGMSGFELRDELANDPLARDVPFVAITGRAAEGDEARAKELGVRTVLSKPIDRVQLLALVQTLLPAPPAAASPGPIGPIETSVLAAPAPCADAAGSAFPLHRQVRLLVSVQALMKTHREVPPADAFVLSRLAGGKLRVEDLLKLCPQPVEQVLEVLERYVAAGIIG